MTSVRLACSALTRRRYKLSHALHRKCPCGRHDRSMSDIEQRVARIGHKTLCAPLPRAPRYCFLALSRVRIEWHVACRPAVLAAVRAASLWRIAPMAGLLNDFRLALRSVRKAPAFAAAAIIVLALSLIH